MENTKEEFKKLSGIDLTDHEHSGVFPYYKNGKWSSISRGKAWQMYAQWLEDQSTSQKETIDRLREQNDKLRSMLFNLMNNPKDFKSGGWYEVSVPMEEITQAEQILSTTEPIDQ